MSPKFRIIVPTTYRWPTEYGIKPPPEESKAVSVAEAKHAAVEAPPVVSHAVPTMSEDQMRLMFTAMVNSDLARVSQFNSFNWFVAGITVAEEWRRTHEG